MNVRSWLRGAVATASIVMMTALFCVSAVAERAQTSATTEQPKTTTEQAKKASPKNKTTSTGKTRSSGGKAAGSSKSSKGTSATSKTHAKATASRRPTAQTIRLTSAFKASEQLRPMAQQLAATRSAAAYGGVENYARVHPGEGAAAAYLALGHAYMLDRSVCRCGGDLSPDGCERERTG